MLIQNLSTLAILFFFFVVESFQPSFLHFLEPLYMKVVIASTYIF